MFQSLTIFLTVFGGVSVFVLGQLIAKFLIEPIHEQKKLIGEIAASMIFYSNVDASVAQHYYDQILKYRATDDPGKDILINRYQNILDSHWAHKDQASSDLRKQASDLLGKTNAIPLYGLWSFFGGVRKKRDILEASTQLIGMSNSTHREGAVDSRIKEIILRLGLKTLARQRGLSK